MLDHNNEWVERAARIITRDEEPSPTFSSFEYLDDVDELIARRGYVSGLVVA